MAARPSLPPSNAKPGQSALPRLVTDPIWSLKQWPVTIEIQGQGYTIPAMPAVDWLSVFMLESFGPEDVLPGLLMDTEQDQVEQFLHSGVLGVRELWELGLEVISQVTGRPWYVALRLVLVAKDAWDAIGGEMAAVRSDASIAAWLDILFTHLVRNIEDSKRTMFLMKLELVPEGWGKEPEKQMEMSADAFLAMAGD